MKRKIIVVHPGKQHSYHLAEALKKEGMLEKYVTTVYNKKFSFTNIFGHFLKGDNKKRFLSRKSEIFDQCVIQYCELVGLILLLLYRIMPNSKVSYNIEKYIHEKVYMKTIKLAKKLNVDAIIFYGGLSKKHFNLKNRICPNIKFIVDVPIATDQYIRRVFENDVKKTGDDYIKYEQAFTWNSGGNIRIPERNLLADGFLVGSTFVMKSLTDFSVNESKIRIVPYGVDTTRFFLKKYLKNIIKIRFLFVGSVNRRKGIHHLFPSFERLDPNRAELIIVGRYDAQDELIKKYMNVQNVKFMGFLTQDKVAEIYRESDVFVLPSLGEGLSQVSIEAMCSGLPIIVSDNAGVNDLISEGVEGFVIPTSDEEALYEKMKWFIENPIQVELMGSKAYETARKYTWDFYGINAVKAIKELLGD